MIIGRVLLHEFHKTTKQNIWSPWIEFKNIELPALISGSRGSFLVSRKHHDGGVTRVGNFEYPSDQIDDFLDSMLVEASSLASIEKWGNVFKGRSAIKKAFDFIHDKDGVGQPYTCLMPNYWTENEKLKHFGVDHITDHNKYREYCRLLSAPVSFPVFFSSPEKVGIYTQLHGNTHSIILHGIKNHMAFAHV